MNRALIGACLLGLSVSTVQADWCDGSKYLFMAMSLPEQLEKAKQSVDDMMKALRLAKAQLKSDSETLKQLRSRYTQLSQETVALCQQGRRQAFPVHYQGVSMENPADLRLRVDLNLVLLKAQREAEIKAVQHAKEVGRLELALEKNHAMLALLKRQQASQSDIKSDPLHVRQFVQSSCHAVKQGQSLLKQVRNVNVGSFLENVVQSEVPTSVPEAVSEQFMADCMVDSGSLHDGQQSWVMQKVLELGEWF